MSTTTLSRATKARRYGEDDILPIPCLRVSVTRWMCVAFAFVGVCAASVSSQQLLDRVVARVNGAPITLTDTQAAIALGVVGVKPGEDPVKTAEEQLIDRELLLTEVARFPPPEPATADIDKQAAAYKAHVGGKWPELTRSTGITDERVRQLARDTLRIQAYLLERFGTAAVVPDEDVEQYYRAHPAEFTRNGRLLPFEDVEAQARQAASAERRRNVIAQWVRDLRTRADISEVTSQ